MDPLDLIRDGKIRRYFRATKKLNVPNLVLHVTQRAAGKEPMFIEDDDYLSMLVLLKEVSAKYSLRIFAFCLMPNHLHLLFSLKETNLYDAMKFLFSRYVMRFNRKYERRGHLVGSPYRQAVCLEDSYLLAASLYIHLNPVRAGLAQDPISYRWSSCRLYHKDGAEHSFLDPAFILDMLAEGDRPMARTIYGDLLRQGGKLEAENQLEQEDAIDRFCSRLDSVISRFFPISNEKSRIRQLSGFDVMPVDELQNLIEEVKGAGRLRDPASREAKKYVIEQLLARGYKRMEVAERLGVSRKTVYNILKTPG